MDSSRETRDLEQEEVGINNLLKDGSKWSFYYFHPAGGSMEMCIVEGFAAAFNPVRSLARAFSVHCVMIRLCFCGFLDADLKEWRFSVFISL